MKRLETADDQSATIAAYHTAEQSSTPPIEKNAEPGEYEPRNISRLISSNPDRQANRKSIHLALPARKQDPASLQG
jgi:hypothetical protein